MRMKWVQASERMPIEHTADQNFMVWHVRESDGMQLFLLVRKMDILPTDRWLDTGADELHQLREENAALKAALKNAREFCRFRNTTMRMFAAECGITPTQLSEWTSEPITTPPQFVD